MERGRLSLSSQILVAYDHVKLWTPDVRNTIGTNVAGAYTIAYEVAAQRRKRGECLIGYKIGFTTEVAMSSFGLSLPMWGRVWDTTITSAARGSSTTIRLGNYVQPKIEPELVVQFHRMPPSNPTAEEIFRSISAISVGFEIVQSHCADWAISGPIAIADGGLHAGLVVGAWIPISTFAPNALELNDILRSATVQLLCNGIHREVGAARNVLGSPLIALRHFFRDPSMRASSDAFVENQFVVTTGSWTPPIPVQDGESWAAQFSDGLGEIAVSFS